MSKQKVCYFIATRDHGLEIGRENPFRTQKQSPGAPHTSIWDFVISFMFYNGIGAIQVIVKQDFFK
jgi:hypothetical protein